MSDTLLTPNLNTAVVNEEQVSAAMEWVRSLSLTSLVKIIVLILVLFVLVQLLSKFLNRIIAKSKIDRSVHSFLRAIVKVLLYFMAVTIVTSSLGIDVSSLIAVLSVAGLAISLALQGALSNLASGLVILTTKPFHVGDYVDVGGSEGTVEEITMTYTRLVTLDHRTVYIPNSTVTTSNVTNYTVDGIRRLDLSISASYDCDVDQVKAALMEAIAQVPSLRRDGEHFVGVNGYGDHAIEYSVRVWCNASEYWDAWFGTMEAVKRAFDQHGIQFTYPHVNVHMVNK